MNKEDVRKRICLALDVDSLALAKEIIKESYEYVGTYKIGKELFVSKGLLRLKFHKVLKEMFFNLKFHTSKYS